MFDLSGHEVDEALNIFKQNISKEISTFPDVELKALIDYFLSTFFRHYQLYLYCMTKEQELDQRASDVEIDAPIVVDELAKGTDIDKWHYQQTMKKIEDEKDSLQMVRKFTQSRKIFRENLSLQAIKSPLALYSYAFHANIHDKVYSRATATLEAKGRGKTKINKGRINHKKYIQCLF